MICQTTWKLKSKKSESLVPAKSKAAYNEADKTYEDFEEWRIKNLVNAVDKNILLSYFEDLVYYSNSCYFQCKANLFG